MPGCNDLWGQDTHVVMREDQLLPEASYTSVLLIEPIAILPDC